MSKTIHIIGAGLAGSEAAWQAANLGAHVILHEMRPDKGTPAHNTGNCAELVCSNSFRSDDAEYNAVGLLHEEMRMLNSLIMREGEKAAVPAGGALAVDRDIFSAGVTKALQDHPNITIQTGEITEIPPEWNNVIIATGPLTSDPLAAWIKEQTGEDELSFFDALAPIVHFESINMDIAWMQSRYDKAEGIGTGKDYINCPMTKDQYETFVCELINAEYGLFKEWELPSGAQTLAEAEIDTPYFDGCMPIEIMAARGPETLRFGPMKPVGLTNPHKGENEQPYAIVQLRQDNALGTLYNIVGFQTKMKWGEQTRIFKTIPGLENAQFARLGGLHRNTFINSPKLLDAQLRLKFRPQIRFAGQITGCEGYVESASVGLMSGRMAASELLGIPFEAPPITTAHGALLGHITGGAKSETFQPMNINFGLFPVPENPFITMPNGKRKKLKGKDRKKAYTTRALEDLENWMNNDRKAA
ncbi:MAG TPA: methylenetetrahydrofolate--tRNA-(uracil(54)-C(5))-methyltransferase (FADH(2)-oxidizing) TrmFO [Alphaproteobacteria bacterium]|nr:methylenetetrahydrofolate--tRNA-(uracil(54)-C(5))-methyltransferase (FADH(2)-oxidizing) TrmFO [Alphaproteobacteria bacterium]USO05976.1 MAG: methylenetetrahydrofolate--tRNA-(uracil(54)-C(5))-methyltransferase (FADH(2)-oxidizing) TrmFO [Rhodospirillales bacterium]HOO81177.1 methylenetetrahydrofolate--tRNA-(uracil(54)-C(5))-methyltransferase (FADH(2)-oxidizing) TrmFO [Alphaproteobacteria bacterium]